MTEINEKILKDIYKERKRGVYRRKYDFGLLLVIGGSEFYSGSPALSALAAFNSGVDMVQVIAPKRAADIIASFSPNLAAYPLEGKWLEKRHLSTLVAMTEAAKRVSRGKVAVVIGGGMGRSKSTRETILEYLRQIDIPTVVDADGIHALAKEPGVGKRKPFLITPHPYEFFVLTKKKVFELSPDKKPEVVREEAARLQVTILLKEKPDIISDGQEIALNRTGSPYMSVGGTGDVLAGICGALLARGLNPLQAGQAAAFLSGKAGEVVAERKKEGLLATEVINAIPEVLH